MPRATFGKDRRLLKSGEFQAVFESNQFRVAHSHLLLLAVPNGLSHSRLGLVVGKKNVPKAVERNRIKRVVRETFRLSQLPQSVDVIFLARKGVDQLSSSQQGLLLNKSWGRLSRRIESMGRPND